MSNETERIDRDAGPATPLEAGLRAELEESFDADLSTVRVHQGPAAADVSRAYDAQAVTQGEHIVFGEGRFEPATRAGRRLLGHEIAHVVQHQSGRDGSVASSVHAKPNGGGAEGPLESEADAAADRVVSGGSAPALGGGQGRRQKQPACSSIADADTVELAAAKATLAKSVAVADSLRGYLSYWFALLYQFITDEEIRNAPTLSKNGGPFLLHFIPVFYDMYAVNAAYSLAASKGHPEEFAKIAPQWKVAFAFGQMQPPLTADLQTLMRYGLAANTAITTAVRAHIQDDMKDALTRAYTGYVSKYCLDPKNTPLDTFKEDFFQKNIPVFQTVQRRFLIVFQGYILMSLGRSPVGADPDTVSAIAKSVGMSLDIKTIYGWREEAWKAAKGKLGQ